MSISNFVTKQYQRDTIRFVNTARTTLLRILEICEYYSITCSPGPPIIIALRLLCNVSQSTPHSRPMTILCPFHSPSNKSTIIIINIIVIINRVVTRPGLAWLTDIIIMRASNPFLCLCPVSAVPSPPVLLRCQIYIYSCLPVTPIHTGTSYRIGTWAGEQLKCCCCCSTIYIRQVGRVFDDTLLPYIKSRVHSNSSLVTTELVVDEGRNRPLLGLGCIVLRSTSL